MQNLVVFGMSVLQGKKAVVVGSRWILIADMSGWYKAKQKEIVEVPMTQKAFEILERRMKLQGSLLFPSPKTGEKGTSIRTAITHACRRAGIERLSIRDG